MIDYLRHMETARLALAQSAELQAASLRLIREAETALQEALQNALSTPLEDSLKSTAPICAHRRAHRPGRPAKIDSDPELQAFIRARIDRHTFIEIADAVAKAFPEDRRVGKSAIHDWFKRS